MQQIEPPPDWLKDWLQLLVIQVVALGGLFVGAWRLLTKSIQKPLKLQITIVRKRLNALRRGFKTDSFNIRTDLTSHIRQLSELERQVNGLTPLLERIEESHKKETEEIRKFMNNLQQAVNDIRDDISDIRIRVARFEGPHTGKL